LKGADLPDVVADEEGNRRRNAGERVKGLSACDVACPKRALPLIADSKYREQLACAYRLLQEAVGSVVTMDELMRRPGSQPLRDLFEDPRAMQLHELKNAQAALELVT